MRSTQKQLSDNFLNEYKIRNVHRSGLFVIKKWLGSWSDVSGGHVVLHFLTLGSPCGCYRPGKTLRKVWGQASVLLLKVITFVLYRKYAVSNTNRKCRKPQMKPHHCVELSLRMNRGQCGFNTDEQIGLSSKERCNSDQGTYLIQNHKDNESNIPTNVTAIHSPEITHPVFPFTLGTRRENEAAFRPTVIKRVRL